MKNKYAILVASWMLVTTAHSASNTPDTEKESASPARAIQVVPAAAQQPSSAEPSSTPISALNKDVLRHIFSFLDGKSLRTAYQVCKDWHDCNPLQGWSVNTDVNFKTIPPSVNCLQITRFRTPGEPQHQYTAWIKNVIEHRDLFSRLRVLDLTECHLHRTALQEFTSVLPLFQNLRRLNLFISRLGCGVQDYGWESYDPKHQSIDDFFGALGQLPKLRTLELKGDRLRIDVVCGSIPISTIVKNIPKIENLVLNNCIFNDPTYDFLKHFTNLKFLQSSSFKDVNSGPLATILILDKSLNVPHLKHLDLIHTMLWFELSGLQYFPQLRILNLTGTSRNKEFHDMNDYISALKVGLAPLTVLESLNLGSNHLTNNMMQDLMPTLCTLPKLIHLNLSRNQLTSLSFLQSGNPVLLHLKTLDVSHNQQLKSPLSNWTAAFEALPYLRTVHTTGTGLSEADRETLKAHFPRITFNPED
ncbi:MAG: F-box/LRR-repeat protein [Alphaproteobacteria bacterium]